MDGETFRGRGRGDAGDAEAGQLGPAHPARVTDQQQGPVRQVESRSSLSCSTAAAMSSVVTAPLLVAG